MGAVLEGSRQRSGDMVQFSIKDNGLGIPTEHLASIFDTFKRLHSNLAGSGMGLSITRRIIQRHGGRVWAEGEVDRGATFHFSLPDPDRESL